MAFMHVSIELMQDAELFDIITRAFDKFEIVERDNLYRRIVCRVEHTELPPGNYFISPSFYHFKDVEPFLLDWGLPDHLKPL